MTPIRVSCTTLESFRLYLQPDQEWMTEAMLVDSILRRSPASPQMARGTAFGAVIESPETCYDPTRRGFVSGGFFFPESEMAKVLPHYDRRGLFEVKTSRSYFAGDVVVVSKADQVVGGQVIETKTTERFDFDKYAASMQWRFMADAFRPSSITYRVFTVAEDVPGVVEVRDVNEFHFFPYAQLHADCAALAMDFRTFVVAKGLDGALRAMHKERGEVVA